MTIIQDMETTVKVAEECITCGHVKHIVVRKDSLIRWESGEESAFHFQEVTPNDKRFLTSGICDNCFPS